jgi:hypothetical protein
MNSLSTILPPVVCDIDFYIQTIDDKLNTKVNPEIEEGEIVADDDQYGIFKCKKCSLEFKDSPLHHCKPFSCPNECGDTTRMDKKELKTHLLCKCKHVAVTCTCCTKMVLRSEQYLCAKQVTIQSS